MPGAQSHIKDGERIVLRRNPHWTTLRESMCIVLLSAVTMVVFAALLPAFAWAGVIILALAVLVLVADAVQWRHTYFILTTDRIIKHAGVFTTEETEIPLDRIFNVEYWQSPMQRMLGVGDLRLETVGDHGRIHLRDVRHPVSTQNRIYNQVQVCSFQGPAVMIEPLSGQKVTGKTKATKTDGNANQVCEQLSQLHRLLKSGVLTRAEFDSKKRQLLDRI